MSRKHNTISTESTLLGLPEPVQEAIRRRDGKRSEVLAWAESDIDRSGRYRDTYAVLTTSEFLVLEPDGRETASLSITFLTSATSSL